MAKYKQVIIHDIDLKKLCKQKGISLRELARRSGIIDSNISSYANNHRVMEEKTWNKIKKELN